MRQERGLGAWRALACLVAILVIVDYISVLRITNNHDFAIYYTAALRLRSGQDIYAETGPFRQRVEAGIPTSREDTPWPYAYPPFLAALLIPLTLLPASLAGPLWTLLCLGLLVASMGLLLSLLKWWTPMGATVGLLLLLQFLPATVGLRLGQIDVPILFFLVATLAAMQAERPIMAGLLLGLVVGLKLFAGLLVLFLLWKRQWRTGLVAGASGVLWAAGSFALVGFDQIPRYLSFTSIYSTGAFAGYPYHQSFNAVFTRAFKENMFSHPVIDAPFLAAGLTIAASILVVVACLWATRRPQPLASLRSSLEFGVAILVTLLVLPPAPEYTFVWTLIPLTITAALVVQDGHGGWGAAIALALAYALLGRSIFVPLPLLRRLLIESHFMVGAVVLFGLVLWLLLHQERKEVPVSYAR